MSTIVSRLAAHNVWATRTLLEACRGMSEAQFTRRFEIGPGSLHDTFRHIIGAMFRWADRIATRPVRESIEKRPGTRTVDELLILLEEASADLDGVCERLRADKRLDDILRVTFPNDPTPVEFTGGTAIMHVYTHGMHHRAQVMNMMRHLGINPIPDVDAIDWELSKSAERRRK